MRRQGLALLLLVLLELPAHADVFAFTDVEGFEKCMQLDHLVETVTTPKGSQARALGPREIQPRCFEAAARLIAQNRTKDSALALIAAGKPPRAGAPRSSHTRSREPRLSTRSSARTSSACSTPPAATSRVRRDSRAWTART